MIMPALHQHLLHASDVQVVLLAGGSVAPAPPLPTAPVARRANLPIEVKLDITIIKHHRELSTTRVQIKPTRFTMVHEPSHVLLASVAVTLHRARRPGVKLETAFGVERVGEGRGKEGAVEVEVVVTGGTSVPGAYADFIAPVALEQSLCVLELELVFWVAEVRYLVVSHGVLVFVVGGSPQTLMVM